MSELNWPEFWTLYLNTTKAKFHYAIADSKLVRSWSPTSFEPDSIMESSLEPVCDQLQPSFESASVMEFGFKWAAKTFVGEHLCKVLW